MMMTMMITRCSFSDRCGDVGVFKLEAMWLDWRSLGAMQADAVSCARECRVVFAWWYTIRNIEGTLT